MIMLCFEGLGIKKSKENCWVFLACTYLGVFIGDLVSSSAAAGHLLDHQLPERRTAVSEKMTETSEKIFQLAASPPLSLVEQKTKQTGGQSYQQHGQNQSLPPAAVKTVRVHVNGSAGKWRTEACLQLGLNWVY